MTLWTAYLLGVASCFALLLSAWLILRVMQPWIMAWASAVPVGFLHVVGMRLRKTDAKVVVGAAIILAKSDAPVSPLQLEAIYMTLPESERDIAHLVRTARPEFGAYGAPPAT